MSRWLVLWSLGICGPMAMSAQKVCSFDTAAHRDTIVATLSVVAQQGTDSVADSVLTRVIGMILRPRFHPPESIATLFYPNVEGPKGGAIGPVHGYSYGSFEFTIRPNGRLNDIGWVSSTGDSATDSAFLRAVREASDSGDGVSLVPLLRSSDGHVRVSMGEVVGSPIVRVRVPIIRAESPPKTRTWAAPRFPSNAIVAGVQGVVELRFLIDETGHVIQNTIRVLSAPYQEFVESAITAILAETFRPAMAGGCPLKFEIEQAVRFSIAKPTSHQ